MPYARIQDGVVAEIFTPPDGLTLSDCFVPEVADQFVSAPGNVQPGWTYDGATFAPYVAPPPDEAALEAYAAAKRYAVETGGVMVGGAPVSTDRESQGLINGAFSFVQANPDASITFKTKAGFVVMDASTIQAVALAVGGHVQACFQREAAVASDIQGGTITTTAEIDDAFSDLE